MPGFHSNSQARRELICLNPGTYGLMLIRGTTWLTRETHESDLDVPVYVSSCYCNMIVPRIHNNDIFESHQSALKDIR